MFVTGFALSRDLCCIFHALLCPCLLKGGKKALLSFDCLLVSLYYNGLMLGSQAFTNFRLHMNIILCMKDWINSPSLIVINHEFELWLRLSLVPHI